MEITLDLTKFNKKFIKKKLIRAAKWCWATLPRRVVSSLVIFVIIAGPVWFVFFKQEAKAEWWNENWMYRQKISITSADASDYTDFQVLTTVDTATLITAGKMLNACQDMRFTDSRGRLLPYWVEENNPGCNNAATKVWIKVPTVFSGTNATSIYMYYGNPSAVAIQSGDKTFEFFDDFNGSSINTAKWTTQSGGEAVSGGNLILNPSEGVWATNYSLDQNVVIESFVKRTGSLYSMIGAVATGDKWKQNMANGYGFDNLIWSNNNVYWETDNDGSGNHEGSYATTSDTNYHKHKFEFVSGTSVKYYYDATTSTQNTNIPTTAQNLHPVINCESGGDIYADFYFTRKYAATEPTTSASAEEIGPGPLAYWKFDEGQGTITQDVTVNNNDGTLGTSPANPTWKPESDCVSGKCLGFDGADDVTNVTHNATLNSGNNISISFWAKPPTAGWGSGAIYRGIVDKGEPYSFWAGGASTGYAVGIGRTSNTIIVSLDGLSSAYYSTSSLDANKWNYVTVTYDNTTLKIYKNGILDYQNNVSATSLNNSQNIAIGNVRVASSRSFQGSLDEVKIYPYARTVAQIQQDYNAGKAGNLSAEGAMASIGQSPQWMANGLVGQWKMDETSGTSVADSSGNGNTGTLTNAQETGTAQAGSTTTTITDSANAALSATDDAYNNMILQITSGALNGTQRIITDYTGATKTFTFAALGSDPTGATYIILHQTGGKFGNGLAFDGENDYDTIPANASLNTTTTVSISAWIKADDFNTTGGVSIGSWVWKTSNYVLGYTTGGAAIFLVYPQSGSPLYYSASSDALTAGQWYHITGTYDGNNLKMFVNGNYIRSTAYSGPVKSDAVGVYIGGFDNGTRNYDGLLDDVRVYNRALSPDEVKALSEYGPGPLGWWKMDENVSGNSKTLYDSSGNGYNLTTNWGANASGTNCTKQGKYGGACENDGVDDKITSSTSALNPQYAVTQEAWVKPNSAGLSSGITIGGGCLIRVDQSNPNLFQPQCRIGGGYRIPSGTKTLTNGEWQHVALTYDMYSRQILFYVNGVLLGNSTLSGLSNYDIDNTVFGNLEVGGRGYSTTYFHGQIDDVRVYDYARSAKQIQQDMAGANDSSVLPKPVGYWKFDEGQGNTAYDFSMNKNNGTLNSGGSGGNATNAAMWDNRGKFGKAMDFDGSNDYVSVVSSAVSGAINSQNFTFSSWIKPSSTSGIKYIFEQGRSTNGYNTCLLKITNGSLIASCWDSDSEILSMSAAYTDTTAFHCVAFLSSGSTAKLYIDGKEAASGSWVNGYTIAQNNFYIGSNSSTSQGGSPDGGVYFSGLIDEVKVYNSALTPAQIKLDMNGGKELQLGGQSSATGATGQSAEYCVPGSSDSCAGPVGEWKFDEKAGGSVNDTSGNGNTGTWYGTGAHWTNGKYGSAGKFNGTDDYVSGSSSSNFSLSSNAATVEFWVNTVTGFTDFKQPVGLAGGNTPWNVYNLGGNKFYIKMWNDAGTGYDFQTYYVTITDNQWIHASFVMSLSGSNMTVSTYQNGQLVGSQTQGVTGTFTNPGIPRVWCTSFGRPGKVDDVKIFNYARTPAQVAWDYNRGKPVGWWKMDEGRGTKAYDSSGFGNTGTLTTMDPPNDWVAGKYGKALDFDGSNDYVDVGSGSSLGVSSNANLTISAWVKPSATDSFRTVLAKGKSTVTFGYGMRISSGNWQATNSSGGTNLGFSASNGVWQHVTIVYKADGTAIGYLNGIGYTAISKATVADTQKLYIGSQQNSDGSPTNSFQGQIDDVRVYNYGLTAEQVKQVMNEGSAVRFGP